MLSDASGSSDTEGSTTDSNHSDDAVTSSRKRVTRQHVDELIYGLEQGWSKGDAAGAAGIAPSLVSPILRGQIGCMSSEQRKRAKAFAMRKSRRRSATMTDALPRPMPRPQVPPTPAGNISRAEVMAILGNLSAVLERVTVTQPLSAPPPGAKLPHGQTDRDKEDHPPQ